MTILDQLQDEVYSNKLEKGFNISNVGDEIILITEELGELARAYKHSNQKLVNKIDNIEEISDAIGDVMIYCLGLCAMLKISSSELLHNIIDNNKSRTHTGFIKDGRKNIL